MSATAQYAASAKIPFTQISVANTARDGTGSVPQVGAAGSAGSRLEKIDITATGVTTAGMVRLFLCEGAPGAPIASITFAATTATVTTTIAHGRTTGDKVTVQGVFPFDYNVKDASVTVLSATSFSYPMATTPTANASILGSYFTTPAVPVMRLLDEIPVSAVPAPSGTVRSFASYLTAATNAWLPMAIPAGYSLRASTHNAETFNVLAQMGDF